MCNLEWLTCDFFRSTPVFIPCWKVANFDITLFNVILQRVLSKKSEAEVEAEINELIALPSSTFVSAQHRLTLIIPPLTTGLEALTHLQRQELMGVLEGLDFESSESRLSWELLEHRITPAPELLEYHSRILKNSQIWI